MPGPSAVSRRYPDPSQGRRSGRVVGEAGRLARALIVHAPRRTALALLLLLAANIAEAFGILMLIPFLGAVGLAEQPGERGLFSEVVTRLAGAVGVELTLPIVLGMFLALAAVRAATGWKRDIVLTSLQLGFVQRFREQIYEAVARAGWEFIHSRRQSDAQYVLTVGMNAVSRSILELMQFTVAAMLVLLQIVFAGLISPVICGLAVLVGGTLLLLTRPLMLRSRALGRELVRTRRDLHGLATDFLAGLKLVKSYGAEEPHVRRFAEVAAAERRRTVASAAARSTARAAVDLAAGATLTALAWLAASTATLTLPELIVLAAIFVRVLLALSKAQDHAQHLLHTLPSYANAESIHRALRDAAEPAARNDEPPLALRRGMAVRHVSFVYTGAAGAPALADVNLDLPAGSLTAIAGPSGAGKTTLADLLLGLIAPADGEVLADGVPLTGSNLCRWRRSVACVPQEPYLFHDTIRANLQWVRPEASEADLWRVLRLAAAEFVAALPEGLDTIVGDRGSRLSGGERQRLGLAQALVREPALLVLDEATSQLDVANERRVLTTIRSLRGRMTVVVIAHRTALLEEADTVVVLEAGRVVGRMTRESGPLPGDATHRGGIAPPTMPIDPAGGPGSGGRTAAARSRACCGDAAGPRCSAGPRRSGCSGAAGRLALRKGKQGRPLPAGQDGSPCLRAMLFSLDVCETLIGTRPTIRGGARRKPPASSCPKRAFATHADRLRPRLEDRRLPDAGPAARRPAGGRRGRGAMLTSRWPAAPARGAGVRGVRRIRVARVFGNSALAHLLRLGDGAAAACAMAGALLIWSLASDGTITWAYVPEHAAWFLLVAPWMLLLEPARRPAVMWSLRDAATAVAHAAVVVGVLYALVFFLSPRELLPRLVVVYFAVLAFSTTIAWRLVFVQVVARVGPQNRVVVVGVGSAARVIADVLRTRTPQNRVVAFVSDGGPAQDTTLTPVVGVDGLERLAAEAGVSELILAHDRPLTPALFRAITHARAHVDVVEMQPIYERLLRRVPIRHLSRDTASVLPGAGDNLSPFAKRAVDVAAGVVGCAVVLLLLPVLAPAIWLDVERPILFRQQRVGLAGRPFQLVKFRTMRSDAERDGPQWAEKRDLRASGFGRFLRRFHIDELPQFWNVLKGEMSLVGPRPERREFTETLERAVPHYAERYAVRPGLTGWAQINYPYGRSTEDAATKLEYDLYYVKHRSLALDLLIASRTAWAILTMGNR